MKIVVADAGPLIGISRVGHVALLHRLYGEILIPEHVREELKLSSHKPGSQIILNALQAGWIRCVSLRNKSEITRLDQAIDAGEAEAIQLAIEQQADLLLIDDRNGRKAAKRRRVPIIGTGGVLIAAKKAGLLDKIAPVLDALTDAGYRLSPALCEQILKLAGEFPPQNEIADGG
jgi:predicted nucleic acid-binding protein